MFICRPVNLLTLQIPAIVKALHKQLREKSVKTRQVSDGESDAQPVRSIKSLESDRSSVTLLCLQGCFHLLLELVAVLPGALSDHISAVVPGIQFSLG